MADFLNFNKKIAMEIRSKSHIIDMTYEELKNREPEINVCLEKGQNAMRVYYTISTIMALSVAFIGRGFLFLFSCHAWALAWTEKDYFVIADRKRWIEENMRQRTEAK